MIGAFVSVVKGVKVVIGVKVKCFVDFFNILRSIITNKTNVPADLRSSVSVVRVVKVVIGVKVKCKRSACFHILCFGS